MSKQFRRLTVVLLAGCGLLWLAQLPTLPTAAAQTLPDLSNPQYRVTETAEGVLIEWEALATGNVSAAGDVLAAGDVSAAMDDVLQEMPIVEFNGYQLPMQLVTIVLPGDAEPRVRMLTQESTPWRGTPAEADPPEPPVLTEATDPEAEEADAVIDDVTDDLIVIDDALRPLDPTVPSLPTTPLFLLREGRMRGVRVAVAALSPVYQEGEAIQAAHKVSALLVDAKLLSASATLSVEEVVQAAGVDTPSAPVDEVAPPSEIASKSAVKLFVEQPGMQRVSGSALLAADLSTGQPLASLHLWLNQQPVALQVIDGDGRLDAASELRFYAPPSADSAGVGDRWNATRVYWLTAEPGDGPRMATRSALPSIAPVRSTAVERGVWEDNRLYESAAPGVDGDHWFALKLNADGGSVEDYTATLPVQHRLSPATSPAETATFTLTGMARTLSSHQLQVTSSGESWLVEWSNNKFYEAYQHTITSTVSVRQLDLELLANGRVSDIRVDKLHWQQPVSLNFSGQGANFSGVAGAWNYALRNVPADSTLYDVTDPLTPQLLETLSLVNGGLNFSEEEEARDYALVDAATLQTPALSRHKPVRFTPNQGAHALYIAPANFHDELAPLVAHREAQGYRTLVVDVQDAYDAWSGGQVDPEAIRSLLRYAVANWSPAPISAVLVGDSTYDPLDYLGLRNGAENANVLPAYLANVDDWIGQTACENCYAQLDGDSPLDAEADPGFLIDIWVGRFSVQDEAQIATVVDKILHYETAATNLDDTWRQTSLYVADNSIQANGALDVAGDFTTSFNRVIEGDPARSLPPTQNPNVNSRRVYYDPSPVSEKPPWHVPDGVTTRLRVIEAMKAGAGFIAYNGHGNHFQWGTTDRTLEQPYLFGTNDIFELQNMDRLPIIAELTCYTGQFTRPSASGTTIDERFQRHPDGGAVAVWASAGLTVAYGHDALLQGFQRELWNSPPMTARLGELTEAGYLELFTRGRCCQSSRYVYLLFGDPLTPARLLAPDRTFLPLIGGGTE